jgi:autotransporter-associated beta strand protein
LSFGGSGSTPYTSTNDITPNFRFATITLSSTASVTEIINGDSFRNGDGNSIQISQSNSGAFNIQNDINSNNPVTLTLTGNGTGLVTLSGVISQSGTQSLSKTGTSTFILSGANTYSGTTTVSAGTLFANNTTGSATGTGAVTVSNAGTTLGGAGTISGAVTISNVVSSPGAILEGGTGSTGQTLTLANSLTLGTNSIIELALGPSLTHSTLARTGTGTWSFQSAQTFTFINLGATTGTYEDIITGLASNPGVSGWTITNAGYTGSFSFDSSNGGIDLTLTAVVPEPSTWIVGALSVLAVGYSQRKRVARLLARA